MVMLRLGIPISGKERPVVLTVAGRTSGKPRSTPVTPMEIGGIRYVVTGFPGADWVRNVRAADHATVSQGRRSERVRMIELSSDEARPVLRAFPVEVPGRRRLHEEVGPGQGRHARRVRGLGRALPGVPARTGHVASAT